MNVLIFCGGVIDDYSKIIEYLNYDMVICADGGAKHLRALGIIPHLLLGDFDSIKKEDLTFYINNNVRILEFPSNKDYTDSELAIDEAIKAGATEISILGATGGRIDHTLSNVFLLVKALNSGIKARILTGDDEILLVNDSVVIEAKKDYKLTLLPIDPVVSGIETTGLQYKLNGETLTHGQSRGVSNCFVDESAQISVKNGILMVIMSRE